MKKGINHGIYRITRIWKGTAEIPMRFPAGRLMRNHPQMAQMNADREETSVSNRFRKSGLFASDHLRKSPSSADSRFFPHPWLARTVGRLKMGLHTFHNL